MKVKELMIQLMGYNLDAELNIIAHNKKQNFTISMGTSEGCTKANCETVSLYLDELCGNEKSKSSTN